ncbi:hypothetical protein ACH5RR_023309 [Cinchona calisaya]|uniref:Uncharacterized protein n=1 Tax=Cinchona calisaya TaxID=153742 RepID=A0ABD2ZE63_9GENT
MVIVQDLVVAHIQLAVQSSDSYFWFSLWLGAGPLANLVDQIHYPALKIGDVFSNDHGCLRGLIVSLVPTNVTEEILQHHVFLSGDRMSP